MNKRQKARYVFAIYVVVAFVALIFTLVAQNSKDNFWQAILLNLSTELFGVVIIFFIVNYFFLASEWDLSERVEVLTERLESIEQAVNRNFLEKLSTRQQQELDYKLRESLNLLIIGVALDRTLNDHYSSMRRLLDKGGKIRVILENPVPDSAAVKMTIKRRLKSITSDGWLGRVRDNLSTLERLKKETEGNLQVRLTDYHLSRGEILVDANSSEGIFFIWLYSFQVEAENQPKFILYPQDKWYQPDCLTQIL
ncbi:hypothetical protein Lepto7375DRAFT_6255 [Leptolyngbya sp. PCC 7375]|nr:hypothetical protein Lepto7375DRAFT_6255 [Leptolyngbya sp. PCC 7375]